VHMGGRAKTVVTAIQARIDSTTFMNDYSFYSVKGGPLMKRTGGSKPHWYLAGIVR